MGTMEFQDVLRAAQRGRADGVRTLVQAHQPALSRVLAGLGVADVETASVTIWRTVLADLSGFSGDEYGLRAWLIDVAQQLVPTTARSVPEPATPSSATSHGAADETARALTMMRTLPSDEATAVLLRVVAGLDSLTVAERTDEGGGRTRQLYQRGLAALVALREQAAYRAGELGERALGHPRRAWTWQDVPVDRVDELLDHEPAFEPHSALEAELVELVRTLRAPDTDRELTQVNTVVEALRPSSPPVTGIGTRAVGALLMAGLLTAGTVGAATAAAGSVQGGLATLVSFAGWEPGWMQQQQHGTGPVSSAPSPQPGRHPADSSTRAPGSSDDNDGGRPVALAPSDHARTEQPPARPAQSTTVTGPTPTADPDPAADDGTASVSPTALPPASSTAPSQSAPATIARAGAPADAIALCQQWTAVFATPGPTLASETVARLTELAGGADRIGSYCAAIVITTTPPTTATATTATATTATTATAGPTGRPTTGPATAPAATSPLQSPQDSGGQG